MPILNLVVIETFARISEASAFLETVNAAIPKLESEEHDYLEQRAASESWEYDEFAVEKDILDLKFRTWVPTLAAYSVIILLHSLVETQLEALAEHLGTKTDAKLRVKDMAGKGIERSALYLERVIPLPIRKDPAWEDLQDLQKLRNIVVHRGGKPGASKPQMDDVNLLIKKHPKYLDLRRADGIHEQLWVSMNLCRRFAESIDKFFERAFSSAGLPNRYMKFEE